MALRKPDAIKRLEEIGTSIQELKGYDRSNPEKPKLKSGYSSPLEAVLTDYTETSDLLVDANKSFLPIAELFEKYIAQDPKAAEYYESKKAEISSRVNVNEITEQTGTFEKHSLASKMINEHLKKHNHTAASLYFNTLNLFRTYHKTRTSTKGKEPLEEFLKRLGTEIGEDNVFVINKCLDRGIVDDRAIATLSPFYEPLAKFIRAETEKTLEYALQARLRLGKSNELIAEAKKARAEQYVSLLSGIYGMYADASSFDMEVRHRLDSGFEATLGKNLLEKILKREKLSDEDKELTDAEVGFLTSSDRLDQLIKSSMRELSNIYERRYKFNVKHAVDKAVDAERATFDARTKSITDERDEAIKDYREIRDKNDVIEAGLKAAKEQFEEGKKALEEEKKKLEATVTDYEGRLKGQSDSFSEEKRKLEEKSSTSLHKIAKDSTDALQAQKEKYEKELKEQKDHYEVMAKMAEDGFNQKVSGLEKKIADADVEIKQLKQDSAKKDDEYVALKKQRDAIALQFKEKEKLLDMVIVRMTENEQRYDKDREILEKQAAANNARAQEAEKIADERAQKAEAYHLQKGKEMQERTKQADDRLRILNAQQETISRLRVILDEGISMAEKDRQDLDKERDFFRKLQGHYTAASAADEN